MPVKWQEWNPNECRHELVKPMDEHRVVFHQDTTPNFNLSAWVFSVFSSKPAMSLSSDDGMCCECQKTGLHIRSACSIDADGKAVPKGYKVV